MAQAANTTQILIDLGNGDRSAANRLMPLVYDEIRRLAARYMQREPPGHTLQPSPPASHIRQPIRVNSRPGEYRPHRTDRPEPDACYTRAAPSNGLC